MRPVAPGQLLKHAHCAAFLVTDFTNIRYLTGLQLTSGVLLVIPRRSVLFVDSRYRDMAERAGTVVVRDLGELPEIMAEVKECGFEAEDVSVLRRSGWGRKFPRTKFKKTVGILQSFRRQKDDDELRALRRAERMTRELLRRVPSVLRRSITEEELARQLLIWTLELGADGLSFDPIVAFGTHTSCPHHRPTSRILQKGHLVQIDVGVKVRGYCGDLSAVYFTAAPTLLQRRVYDALCRARDRAIAAAKPGASTRSLDRLARTVLSEEGVEQYFTHALGHGVGLEVHEGVSLSQKAPDAKLLSGEVITIEPGVYFPGKFGMRLESMKFVT